MSMDIDATPDLSHIFRTGKGKEWRSLRRYKLISRCELKLANTIQIVYNILY